MGYRFNSPAIVFLPGENHDDEDEIMLAGAVGFSPRCFGPHETIFIELETNTRYGI